MLRIWELDVTQNGEVRSKKVSKHFLPEMKDPDFFSKVHTALSSENYELLIFCDNYDMHIFDLSQKVGLER